MAKLPLIQDRKPGDTWQNEDGSVSTVNDDGSIYTTPGRDSMGGATPATKATGAQQAMSGATNLAAARTANEGIAALSPSSAGSEMVGFGSDAGATLPQFGSEMGAGEFVAGVPYAVPSAAGIGVGAYGLYDLFNKNAERSGTGKGILQGAGSGAATGAGIGTFIAPGAGTLIGAGIGATVGGIAGAFGTKSRTRGEQHQRDALIARGINVPIDQTARDGKAWENNATFAKTRNEADLVGNDIKDASDFYAQIPGYEKLNDAQKTKVAQQALNSGLVREKLGKINVNMADSADYQAWVKQMMDSTATPQNTGGGGSGYNSREERKKQIAKDIYDSSLDPRLTDARKENHQTYNFSQLLKNKFATR